MYQYYHMQSDFRVFSGLPLYLCRAEEANQKEKAAIRQVDDGFLRTIAPTAAEVKEDDGRRHDGRGQTHRHHLPCACAFATRTLRFGGGTREPTYAAVAAQLSGIEGRWLPGGHSVACTRGA